MRSISFYILLGVILFAPLLLGSNTLIAWYFNAFFVGLALLAFTYGVLSSYDPITVPMRRIAWPVFFFVVVLAWGLLQTLPHNLDWVSHPLWQASSEALGLTLSSRLSITPEQGWQALLKLTTYGVVFWLVLQFSRDPKRAHFMLYGFIFAVTLYASYGLILKAFGSETILWFAKEHYRDSLTATFINRNTAATYFGLGCVALLALFISYLRRRLSQRMPQRVYFSHLISTLFNQKALLLLYALGVTFSALVLTGSRAGLLAGILGMICVLMLYIIKSNKGYGLALSSLALLAGFMLVFLETGGTFISQRFQDLTLLEDTSRLAVYKLSLNIIADFLLTGTGLGSFGSIFPMYRDSSISSYGVWDKAHNTYLELFIELGIPIALCLLLCVLLLVMRTLQGFFSRKKNSHFTAIALASSVLVGAHAFVDFSLQIQGLTLSYIALLALGVGQSWGSRIRV